MPETLVGAAVMVVMIGAIVPLLWIAAGQLGGQSDRISALDQDRVAFDDMTRLIRGARQVEALDETGPLLAGTPVEAGKLELVTGNPERDPVVIDCGLPGSEVGRYRCLISAADGSSKPLIDGITDPEPFAVDANRTFVSVSLQMSPPGASRPISLQGGASLRTAGVD